MRKKRLTSPSILELLLTWVCCLRVLIYDMNKIDVCLSNFEALSLVEVNPVKERRLKKRRKERRERLKGRLIGWEISRQ